MLREFPIGAPSFTTRSDTKLPARLDGTLFDSIDWALPFIGSDEAGRKSKWIESGNIDCVQKTS